GFVDTDMLHPYIQSLAEGRCVSGIVHMAVVVDPIRRNRPLPHRITHGRPPHPASRSILLPRDSSVGSGNGRVCVPIPIQEPLPTAPSFPGSLFPSVPE